MRNSDLQILKDNKYLSLNEKQLMKLLIRLKKECDMDFNVSYILKMDIHELKRQVKHYRQILSTVYGY